MSNYFHVRGEDFAIEVCPFGENNDDCPQEEYPHTDNYNELLIMMDSDEEVTPENFEKLEQELINTSRKAFKEEFSEIQDLYKNDEYVSEEQYTIDKYMAYNLINASDTTLLEKLFNMKDPMARTVWFSKTDNVEQAIETLKTYNGNREKQREYCSKIVFANFNFDMDFAEEILANFGQDEYIKSMVEYKITLDMDYKRDLQDFFKRAWFAEREATSLIDEEELYEAKLYRRKKKLDKEYTEKMNQAKDKFSKDFKQNVYLLRNIKKLQNDATYQKIVRSNPKVLIKRSKTDKNKISEIEFYFVDKSDNRVNLSRYKQLLVKVMFKAFAENKIEQSVNTTQDTIIVKFTAQ